jgi:hypothetical protein
VNVHYHLQDPGTCFLNMCYRQFRAACFLFGCRVCLSLRSGMSCMYVHVHVCHVCVHTCVQVGAVHDMFKHTYMNDFR